jgi:hypothetical protein
MFGFVIVQAYPDAEENEFICSQWERKGMHTDIHCTGQRNMGSKPNVLHFAVWIST